MIRRGLGYSVVWLAGDILAALEDLELDLWRDASQAVVFHYVYVSDIVYLKPRDK